MAMRVTVHARLHAHPRPHVLVRVVDDEGLAGTGEASPLPPFSKEDAAMCQRALATSARWLGEVDEALPPAEAASVALAEAPLEHVPSARFALETALLDRLGQRHGVPISACLAGGATLARLLVNALLIADASVDMAERAALLMASGFSAIKIKLRARDDAGFARELGALREVRARLPLPYELRLDANGFYSLDTARRRLEALAPIAPRYVEQPVPADLLLELGECAVPWAADESLARPELAEALLDAPGCAAFILKPAILGGLARARHLALAAMKKGIGVVVTHLCDGPAAMAAASELALSLPKPPLACGLAPHADLPAFLREHHVVAVPQLAGRFEVTPSGGPGLGLSLEAAYPC
jgi:L-alanine-DL-glutamate epimerase-like enolase superfamily enzyme